MTDTATVFIVDDDPAILSSISAVLDGRGWKTECFRSPSAFLREVEPNRPGCLVLDVRLPGMTGIQLLRKLVEEGVFRPTVVITGCAEVETAVEAMKLGAIDFLQKPFPPEQLVKAVERALELDQRERTIRERRFAARCKIDTLSEDERSVLAGIARGLTNQQIADELDVSLRTIQFRRTAIFKALGVASKPELLALLEQADWPAGLK